MSDDLHPDYVRGHREGFDRGFEFGARAERERIASIINKRADQIERGQRSIARGVAVATLRDTALRLRGEHDE